MAPRTTKKSKLRRWLFIILLILAAGTGWHFWRQHQQREVPIQVTVDKVTRRDITENVIATGRLHPVTKVVINPEVAGEIVLLPVKEGQAVKQGDLLVRIKADTYMASRDLAKASYDSSQAQLSLSEANRDKAKTDYERAKGLFGDKLISEAEFLTAENAFEVASASARAAEHGVEQAKARLDQAEEDLAKTKIVAPIDGTIVQLRSEQGERVVGTSLMSGTEIMTVAQLDLMEARVEVGEMDVVMIAIGQKARIEVDAFQDDAFAGEVTEIANASNTAQMSNNPGSGGGGQGQEATKFQVKIRLRDKEIAFRPGMSVTAYIETRSVEAVLSVPLQSVTARITTPAPGDKPEDDPVEEPIEPAAQKKRERKKRVQEVVFVVEGNRAKQVDVTSGISDDDFVEIVDGLEEGQEVVTGNYRAINRDLKDGALIEREVGEPSTTKENSAGQ